MSSRAIVLGAIAALAGTAVAEDKPLPADPEARRAGEEANLESTARRRGFVGGAFLGPSFTIGGGTGTGGSVSLRLGQVAGARTVISFELDGSGQLRKRQVNAMETELVTNTITSFLVGVQQWIGPSVSIRILGGVGVYICSKCATNLSDQRYGGLAGGAAVGIDLVRFKGLVLGIEARSINQLNRDGLVSTNSLSLGLSFD